MNPLTQSVQITQIQDQQTQQHNLKELISWISTQIAKKNLPSITSLNQLSSGNLFLQIVSIYYPKKVDLTKTFMNPKDDYEILQNFKQLSYAFSKLGWKKFDPEKFRKRKDKELVSMAQYLKRILSQHLFDGYENTGVHTILINYPSPDKLQMPKQHTNELIKIEDRKYAKIPSQMETLNSRESEPIIRKKSENLQGNKLHDKTSKSKQVFPPKPLLGIQTQRLSKQSKLSPKLPPHPQTSSNIVLSKSNTKNEEEQLNNFENMRITKLEREKKFLMKKILSIQQLVAKQKGQAVRKNLEMKILDQVNESSVMHQQEQQKQSIQRVKSAILSILSDVQL